MAKTLAKESITESSIQDGGAIVIEDVQWSSTDEQSILRNAQRAVEDMIDISSQSHVRNGLTLTNTTSTLELAVGRALVNGRWLRVTSQQDFAPANMLSGAGMVGEGNRMVGLWIEEQTDNFIGDGNNRDVSDESFYLWEDAEGVTIPDNVIPIAFIVRGADPYAVTSIANLHDDDFTEIRGNDIIPLDNQTVRIKDWRGVVIATFASGSMAIGDGGNTADATFSNDVDVVNDLTTGNDLVVGNNATVSGAFTVAGALVAGTTFLASGAAVFENTVDIQGVIANSIGDINFNDNVNIATNLVVSGTSDLRGNITNDSTGTVRILDHCNIEGTLSIDTITDSGNGDLTINTPIDVPASAVQFGSTLATSGAASFYNQVNFAGGTTYKVEADGDAVFKDVTVTSLTVSGYNYISYAYQTNFINEDGWVLQGQYNSIYLQSTLSDADDATDPERALIILTLPSNCDRIYIDCYLYLKGASDPTYTCDLTFYTVLKKSENGGNWVDIDNDYSAINNVEGTNDDSQNDMLVLDVAPVHDGSDPLTSYAIELKSYINLDNPSFSGVNTTTNVKVYGVTFRCSS